MSTSTRSFSHKPPKKIKTALRGDGMLLTPFFNKGTAFTQKEREDLGLQSRLPLRSNTLEQQLERSYQQYKSRESNLRKNSFLNSLKAQNIVLFYALLSKHLKEMLPIIYTPTEAEAISEYSSLFRRPEGLFLSPTHADSMEQELLEAFEDRAYDLVVVSDGEQILGIGDQGSGAIGISSSKAVIYTLIGGIDPSRVIPIALDVGTDNPDLRNDPLYVGWDHERLRGKEYSDFIQKFVGLIKKHQPRCLLHFEDFGVGNAQKLLDLYQDQLPVFNDDIQGTGAITLATLKSALNVTGQKLADQRIVHFGAGSAGLGISRQIRDAMVLEADISPRQASQNFWLIDKHGLIKKDLGDKIRNEIEKDFVRQEDEWDSQDETGLLEVVRRVKPTVLIGTSTKGGAFTEEVVREMAKHVERPIILPLSNPSRLHECQPADAMKWTDGKALMATGSPFDPVDLGNGKSYTVAECNNALLYPGLGLGVVLCDATRVSDKLLVSACDALADLSPAKHDPSDSLLPGFEHATQVAVKIACAVIKEADKHGMTRLEGEEIPTSDDGELETWVRERMWKPEYPMYEYDPEAKDVEAVLKRRNVQ